MTHERVTQFARCDFRAGVAFELVLFERLPIEEQAALAELCADPDFYGVLRPRPGSRGTIKGVNKDTALLWLTLQSPGPLPRYVWADDTYAAVQGITELVLDGVLEMEDSGAFVSGPRAAELLSNGPRNAVTGRLAQMSRAALRYAESLKLDDSNLLCGRLYRYGRQPLSPSWSRRLGDRDAVMAFLGAEPGSRLRKEVDTSWEMANPRELQGWIAWGHRRRTESVTGKGTCKLYVSPAIEAMPTAFASVLTVLADRGGHFKIGCDATGLLRPDKMVLYFGDPQALLEAANELAKKLEGVPAHGVPFSAEIAGDGLLSWGMDPPAKERFVAWQEQESWRLWVARRLAAAMIAAQATDSPSMMPADFALERLRHEGVDVDGWTPSASLWQAA